MLARIAPVAIVSAMWRSDDARSFIISNRFHRQAGHFRDGADIKSPFRDGMANPLSL